MKANRGNKTPAPELERRIDQAEIVLLQGLSRRQAQKLLSERYNVSRRTATRYVTAAYKRWRESAQMEDGRTTDERRVEHEKMIKLIAASAVREGRLDLQLRAVEMLINLHGTKAGSKVELTGKAGGPLQVQNLSDHELQTLLKDAGVKQPRSLH